MSERITFEGLHNVRDLGGTRVAGGCAVKHGLLLRADQPAGATAADRAKLAELGVRTIIDLRSQAGRDEKPDPEVPGATNLHLPIIKDVRAGITRDSKSDARVIEMLSRGEDVSPALVGEYMQAMYRAFVSDAFACAQYARFVDEVIDNAQRGHAVLWHCTAGKDRAGFAAVILLEALGASRNDIVEDYLFTNECLADFVNRLLAGLGKHLPTDTARQAARSFFLADERYLAAAYAEADELYGSFQAFADQALGIDAAKQCLMRELLCE